MDLEARKITFVQEFLRLQNEEILSGLEKLLRKRKVEMLEQQAPMSIEQFHSEIDQSIDDAKNGGLTEVINGYSR